MLCTFCLILRFAAAIYKGFQMYAKIYLSNKSCTTYKQYQAVQSPQGIFSHKQTVMSFFGVIEYWSLLVY